MTAEPKALDGIFEVVGDHKKLTFSCPGCGAPAELSCNEEGGERGWLMEGSDVIPTLFPSVIRRCCNTEWALISGFWHEAAAWKVETMKGEPNETPSDNKYQPPTGHLTWTPA
jgi:hypothetical protein